MVRGTDARSGMRQLAAGILVAWWLAAEMVLPLRADDPQRVTFRAEDGFHVYADFYQPATHDSDTLAPMALLLPMEKSDRTAFATLIKPLREAGFAVLAIDLRGQGQSATNETRERAQQDDPRLYREFQQDLLGAYDWLAKQRGVDRARLALVAAGSTVGAAVKYATEDHSVDAIVCLSPDPSPPSGALASDFGQLRGRKILLVGAEDEKDKCDELATRGEDVEKHIFDGSAHGTDMLGSAPKIEKELVEFLTRGVGKPSKTLVYGSIKSNIYHIPDSKWVEQIDPSNLRHYSSPQEAESRGLRAAKSQGPRERSTDRGKSKGGRTKP
jgi:hypothetical protein